MTDVPDSGNLWETVDGIANRQPAFCPYCGHDNAFDGLGSYGEGYRHHCPSCDLTFVTFLPGVMND
jgi:transposase-like protein